VASANKAWGGRTARRVHLLPRFSRIELLTEASCQDYYRARLRKASRATEKKERSTLVRFVRWASNAPGRNAVRS